MRKEGGKDAPRDSKKTRTRTGLSHQTHLYFGKRGEEGRITIHLGGRGEGLTYERDWEKGNKKIHKRQGILERGCEQTTECDESGELNGSKSRGQLKAMELQPRTA